LSTFNNNYTSFFAGELVVDGKGNFVMAEVGAFTGAGKSGKPSSLRVAYPSSEYEKMGKRS
jgi:hypothetical protein